MIDFIRPDHSFDSVEALVAQMDQDCARARDILAEVNRNDPMKQFLIGRATSALYN